MKQWRERKKSTLDLLHFDFASINFWDSNLHSADKHFPSVSKENKQHTWAKYPSPADSAHIGYSRHQFTYSLSMQNNTKIHQDQSFI